jgi:hypothetical protein
MMELDGEWLILDAERDCSVQLDGCSPRQPAIEVVEKSEGAPVAIEGQVNQEFQVLMVIHNNMMSCLLA